MPQVTPPAALLAGLPAPVQARLLAIGEAHRTEFGTNRDYQAAFDEHIAFFDELIGRGASHKVIGELLAEVGIARADGSPLPLGTISGALSRARERAVATRPAAVPAAARPLLPDPAGPRSGTQEPAGPRKATPSPTRPATTRPRTADTPPAAKPLTAERPAQKSADILNQIRSRQ